MLGIQLFLGYSFYNMSKPENPDNRSEDTFSFKNPFDSRHIVKRGDHPDASIEGVNTLQTNSVSI